MTRTYIAPWPQTVPCPSCGRERVIRGKHPWFFERAAARPCASCSQRRKNHAQCALSSSPAIAAARAFEPDPQVVDWVTVDRLVSGTRTRATKAERLAAVAEMTAHRIAASVIADRLGITPRTVTRLRRELRETAPEGIAGAA